MGENLHHVRHAEPLPTQKVFPLSHVDQNAINGHTIINGEEESYTIKCVCGFNQDDGATVYCEHCDTWQHIACYYPDTQLAADAEHSCIDCNPRQHIDATAAAHRQRLRAASEEPKAKKAGSKNHRKSKTKDLNNAATQVNGFATDSHFASPSTGSPRDSQPPTKRPKTNHRLSTSLSNGHARPSNGRHRSISDVLNLAAPPKPPLEQCPPDYLSKDFIRVHQENTNFNTAQANMHVNITVTNLLSTWLDDQEEFEKATNGKTHSEVFQHFPQPIEELEIPIQKHTLTEPSVSFHGATPKWPYLSVDQDVVAKQLVGELRGCIGRIEDYQDDSSNQWNKLRHPDHFVFFHPSLPMYIDSRQEGTVLRYVRRSCRPNLKMDTIITGRREYRFCFTAMRDISRGEEITIAWDTNLPQLKHALSKGLNNMSPDDYLYVSKWVGINLAHFGGCACERTVPEGPCLLAPFDWRASKDSLESLLPASKPRKKKSKKAPTATTSQGTNSRESSTETTHPNQNKDVDMQDDRSTSRSTHSSRDTTPSAKPPRQGEGPNGHWSEREKRKMAQLQRLFDQVGHAKGPSDKKRKSASGSNAQTPVLISQRQSSRPELSNSNPTTPNSGYKGPFDPPSAEPNGPSPTNALGGRAAETKASHQSLRPAYSDASTQTENDSSATTGNSQRCRRKYLPPSKQLLRRSLLQSQLRSRSTLSSLSEVQKSSSPSSPADSQPMDIESSGSGTPADQEQTAHKEEPNVRDTAMTDVEPLEFVEPASQTVLRRSSPKPTFEDVSMIDAPYQHSKVPAHPPINLPAPPWSSASPSAHLHDHQQSPTTAFKGPTHIDLPPGEFVKPTIPVLSPSSVVGSSASVSTPSVLTSAPAALSTPSLETQKSSESPSLTKPSPTIKKKMSLSDYMNKKKLETPNLERSLSAGTQRSPPGSAGAEQEHKSILGLGGSTSEGKV